MKQGKRKSVFVRLLALVFSVYLLFTLFGLWKEVAVKEKELAGIRQEKILTDRQIEQYEELLKEGNETKIIEKAARERLGYVYADEQVYIDISGN